MHIDHILRERCGSVPITAYYNSRRGSNCRLTITYFESSTISRGKTKTVAHEDF
jgi:hypothetical protein